MDIRKVAYSTTRDLLPEEKEGIKEAGWWEFRYDRKLPISIEYRNPETLGMDRLAAAVGAARLRPSRSKVIADAGTALTLELVMSDGRYLGGNISPGMKMRFRALHEFTSRLPLESPACEKRYYGTDTASAIRCGAEWGTACEIAGFYRRAAEENGCQTLILTGGDAEFLLPIVEQLLPERQEIIYYPWLVALGLKTAYTYNHDTKNK